MPAAEERPPKALADLAAQVETDGGRALAAYREPVGGHWQVFALLPRERFTPAALLRWLHDTQDRNERAKRSHAKRRALRRQALKRGISTL